MLLSADFLKIIFVKIYCYWTRTVGVIAKGSRGPVFLRHSVDPTRLKYIVTPTCEILTSTRDLS